MVIKDNHDKYINGLIKKIGRQPNIYSKSKKDNWSLEIIRCIKFIISQIKKGISCKDAITQAEQSYGYSITVASCEIIEKNLNKDN